MLHFCLASFLCSTTCGTAPDLVDHYFDCLDPEYKEFGSNHFILQKCDVGFDDILDAAEWTTLEAGGDIKLSVPGKLVIGEPSFTAVPINGCGDQQLFGLTYLIDYETYYFDSALEDWFYWDNIFRYFRNYRIMFLDCEGRFFMEYGWAKEAYGPAPATIAGETPGFKFDMSKPPHIIEGDGGQAKWGMQFSVRTGKDIMGQALLPGVQTVLGAI